MNYNGLADDRIRSTKKCGVILEVKSSSLLIIPLGVNVAQISHVSLISFRTTMVEVKRVEVSTCGLAVVAQVTFG